MAEAILCVSGVYAIRNTANGKRYVGSSLVLVRRRSAHFQKLRCGKHHSLKLQRAWSKYGASCFVFEILECVEDANALLEREQHWIGHYQSSTKSGYNISQIAGSPMAGLFHTEDARKRISTNLSAYLRQPEVRAKMSAVRKGRKVSDETKARQSAGRRGILHTEECKDRLREIAKNRPPPGVETKARIAASMTGQHAGERNPMAKMTAETVVEIRHRKALGEAVRDLAMEFSMSVRQTRDIVNRRSWVTV